MTKEISRSKLESLLIKIKKVGFHKGNSQQILSDSRDAQPVRFEFRKGRIEARFENF